MKYRHNRLLYSRILTFSLETKRNSSELMFQTIETSFYRNWIMNQIKFIGKNYRKLSSVIQNRKMKSLKNQQLNRNYFILSIEFSSSQLSIVSIFALALAFTFAFASILIRLEIVHQRSVNQKNVEKWYQQQTSSQTLKSVQY